MGRKPKIPKHQVFKDVSMDAERFSRSTVLDGVDLAKYYISWSGTAPVGKIVFQTSDDGTDVKDIESDWFEPELDVGDSIEINTDSGEILIHIKSIDFKKSRLKYEFTSGNGTINAWIKGNTIGA